MRGWKDEERTLPLVASIRAVRARKTRKYKKKLTRRSIRKLVKQLLNFFHEHPEFEIAASQTSERDALRKVA